MPLVAPESEYAASQPTDEELVDYDWREDVFFDDADWQVVSGAVGYDLHRSDTDNVGFEHGVLTGWRTRGPVRVVD